MSTESKIVHINTKLLTRGKLKAQIIKVNSPSLFWVQLLNSQEELEELTEDLTRRVERKSKLMHIPPDQIKDNIVVAIKEEHIWRRGEVLYTIDKTVYVALRDWGRTIKVPFFEIYLLEDRFCHLRWPAIPCGLAYLRPLNEKHEWSE
ncbi:hypothetical protein PUN28_003738 [Cardiocondyla obscurior]|uniref:Tudor domain-containing protein n=1 Tax=Cardiocondyla obscurior TaxID=286306 RepID=A0AAW2GLZ1_9HYME